MDRLMSKPHNSALLNVYFEIKTKNVMSTHVNGFDLDKSHLKHISEVSICMRFLTRFAK